MKKRTYLSRLVLTGMMIISMGIFAGCSSQSSEQAMAGNQEAVLTSGGTLVLRVNPEIAIEYDENGRVTAVHGKNEDGKDIVAGYQDYIGKECREVVGDLVSAIHEAGYFVEEVEGEGRKITIEIETGSVLPGDQFLEEIVTDIKQYVTDMNMNSPVVVEGGTDDGVTIYDNTDYGVSAYDVSPYDAFPYDETPYEIEIPVTSAPADETPAAASPQHTADVSPYEGTDYSPYEETDYSPYEETNYSPYEETDYSPYEESAYTPYVEPAAPVTPPAPAAPPAETTDYSPYEESNYTPYEESAYEESAYTPYEESAYEESDYSPYEESNYSDYSDYD